MKIIQKQLLEKVYGNGGGGPGYPPLERPSGSAYLELNKLKK
ncbi:hypothetical protein [Pseudoalteromonas luteoviolacea]|uniref:Uncharacterized protein n=1 Tax=Pseudoalteromonas luteoviolacea S4060-1 TaxID=1365257 RepID=A0A167N5I8_9GAMM|nr:hypothetical protein [Pseudoalteromonas luteoviolacea]KZN67537.1 hypothetical protein N478_01940 [Pseudoalteromonas luteoviolacea S4060-1]